MTLFLNHNYFYNGINTKNNFPTIFLVFYVTSSVFTSYQSGQTRKSHPKQIMPAYVEKMELLGKTETGDIESL